MNYTCRQVCINKSNAKAKWWAGFACHLRAYRITQGIALLSLKFSIWCFVYFFLYVFFFDFRYGVVSYFSTDDFGCPSDISLFFFKTSSFLKYLYVHFIRKNKKCVNMAFVNKVRKPSAPCKLLFLATTAIQLSANNWSW